MISLVMNNQLHFCLCKLQ